MITTAEAERERDNIHHTSIYSLSHTQYERADQAPNIGSDDYRNIRRQSAVLVSSLRAPPKSQPQVPAPACLPSPAHAHRIHITLLHFFTPAHSRSSRYNQLSQTAAAPLSSPTHSTSLLVIHPSTIPTTTNPFAHHHNSQPTNTTMYLLTSTIPQEQSCAPPTL